MTSRTNKIPHCSWCEGTGFKVFSGYVCDACGGTGRQILSVDPGHFRRALLSLGWTENPPIDDLRWALSKEHQGEQVEVEIPTVRALGDYERRLGEAVYLAALVEGKTAGEFAEMISRLPDYATEWAAGRVDTEFVSESDGRATVDDRTLLDWGMPSDPPPGGAICERKILRKNRWIITRSLVFRTAAQRNTPYAWEVLCDEGAADYQDVEPFRSILGRVIVQLVRRERTVVGEWVYIKPEEDE